MISRSVAQIATASMRTSTSALRGTGIGLSRKVSSPGLPSTHAFMVSGIGNAPLVFTPTGRYMPRLPHQIMRLPREFREDILGSRLNTSGLFAGQVSHRGNPMADAVDEL